MQNIRHAAVCCIRRTPRLCDSFLCSFLFPCCSASFIPFLFFCFSGICFCKKVADFARLLPSLWFKRSWFFFCYLDIWLKCNFNQFPIMSAGNRFNLPVVSYSASSGSFSYSFGITGTIFPFSLTHFQHLLRFYLLTSCVVFF